MKFSSTLATALLCLAKLIVADSETFGFLSIRSGSSLQYASAYSDNGNLMLGNAQGGLSGVVDDNGKVKLSDNTYIVVASDGSLKEGSEAEATAGFSILDGHLAYNGLQGFYGIPNGNAYTFSTTSGDGSLGVLIKAISSSGQSIADFSPSGPSNTTTTVAPTQTGNNTTTTLPPSYNSTTYYPSHNGTLTTKTQTETNTNTNTITCTSCPIIQTSTNGVNKLGYGMCAGVVGAAAALLL